MDRFETTSVAHDSLPEHAGTHSNVRENIKQDQQTGEHPLPRHVVGANGYPAWQTQPDAHRSSP